MIGFLQGTARGTDLVMVGGVGYLLTTPGGLTDGEDVALHVVTQIREDAFDLYGFRTEPEATLFRTLLRASGVGARTAIGMMRDLGPATLARALAAGDTATLSRANGVGARTAQKICAALTIPDTLLVALGAVEDAPPATAAPDDLAGALTGLGYPEKTAAAAAATARAEGGPDADFQSLLRLAIRACTTAA